MSAATPKFNPQDEVLLNVVMDMDGDLKAIKKALDAGANVDACDEVEGKTALMWTFEFEQDGTSRLLLEQGANINAKSFEGYTPLMIAAMTGNASMVKLLLEKGADASIKDNNDETALDHAQGAATRKVLSAVKNGRPASPAKTAAKVKSAPKL